MPAAAKARRKRARGSVEELPSGALRVSVYAGFDPLTGRRHYLREVIPPGTKAAADAEKAMRRLAGQVDERRNPRTNASLDQLLDRYLETLDVSPTTHAMYAKYLEKHVRPFVGRLKAGAVGAEALDSLYTELRRCRIHCSGRGGMDHRTPRPHECDERCRAHRCNPLSSTTMRHIHFILRAAYEKGVRWRWVATNPVLFVDAPLKRAPDPQPPSPEEAARIVEEAFSDPDWGTLVWLTMTTGARRGELCGLRWWAVDLERGALTIRRAITQFEGVLTEKDTKTHQQRRLALDEESVAVLTEHWERCRDRAAAVGEPLPRSAFVFSLAPDGSTPLVPPSVSQRYSRLAARLGIETHLHCLRHYSATELIAAGVDVRTVAGRLGHAGGGVTTLRVYAAWLSEADQRAATTMSGRTPARPVRDEAERIIRNPQTTRERLAVELRGQILSGEHVAGEDLPGVKVLAAKRGVSPSTVQRAYQLLQEWALVETTHRQRTRVIERMPRLAVEDQDEVVVPAVVLTPRMLALEVRRAGKVVARLMTDADPTDATKMRKLLAGAVRRIGQADVDIAHYEMIIADMDGSEVGTFVVA